MTFREKLENIIQKNNSLLCVGLDSDVEKQYAFNTPITDATHDLVCAYKINSAFYEARGLTGIEALKQTCDYIRQKYPEIILILDVKRADIGSTNEGYAKFAFDWLEADAITLHPYLGNEALRSFLDRKDKGCIILCRTSNPGAGEIQDLVCNGKPLYQVVAEKVSREWNTNGNCGLVVGATYPEELNIVRHIVGDNIFFLIPGIGRQGGNLEASVKAGRNRHGSGMIISASRSIIFASRGPDFSSKAREEVKKLKSEINTYRFP